MSNQANVAAQEAAQVPNAPTQYTVSPNTAMFLDILREQDQLHSNIANAIEKYYGVSQQAEKYLERDFYPILQSLRSAIFEYVKCSINRNTGNTISNQLIWQV